MTLMRSERFTTEKISTKEYKELKYILDNTNTLITIYSKRYAPTFHLKNFSRFMKIMYQEVSKIEKEKGHSIVEIKNEEISHLRDQFGSMVPWIIITHLPTLFKTFILALIPASFIAKTFGASTKTVKSFKDWIGRHINNPSIKNFNLNYH